MRNLYERRQAKLEMYRLQYEQQYNEEQQPQPSVTDCDDEYDEIDCASRSSPVFVANTSEIHETWLFIDTTQQCAVMSAKPKHLLSNVWTFM